jgi:type IV pilus assembly protein PilV
MRQTGFLMLEALVTLVLLLFGLLGLVALQARAQQAETESYQRVQALILLRDMADRINANHYAAAGSYDTGTTPLGNSSTKDCSAPATVVDIDLCQWSAALVGVAETSGGTNVGAMIGARGCIAALATSTVPNPKPGPGLPATVTITTQYLVQVVWQGLVQTSNPPSSVGCGKDLYGDEGVSATLGQRRAATTVVNIGTLTL